VQRDVGLALLPLSLPRSLSLYISLPISISLSSLSGSLIIFSPHVEGYAPRQKQEDQLLISTSTFDLLILRRRDWGRYRKRVQTPCSEPGFDRATFFYRASPGLLVGPSQTHAQASFLMAKHSGPQYTPLPVSSA